MRQLTSAVDYTDPAVIEEAFEWKVKQQAKKGDPAGNTLRRMFREDLEDPEEVRAVLQHKADELRREQADREMGEAALEKRAARAEDQRRRRGLLNAHRVGCGCVVGPTGLPEGECKELSRARLIPIRQVERLRPRSEGGNGKIKDLVSDTSDTEFQAYYSGHLGERADVTVFDWLSVIGGELFERVKDLDDAHGGEWSTKKLQQIRDFCEVRFKRKFDLYGKDYWRNTALRNMARKKFEDAVNHSWGKLGREEY